MPTFALMGRRIVVTGGRNYADRQRVFDVLDQQSPTHIAHGGASGADALAGEWAQSRGVKCTVYPANWQAHGKAAGPIRNRDMLLDFAPDGVIAFAGGNGTAHCVSVAQDLGLAVLRVDFATSDAANQTPEARRGE